MEPTMFEVAWHENGSIAKIAAKDMAEFHKYLETKKRIAELHKSNQILLALSTKLRKQLATTEKRLAKLEAARERFGSDAKALAKEMVEPLVAEERAKAQAARDVAENSKKDRLELAAWRDYFEEFSGGGPKDAIEAVQRMRDRIAKQDETIRRLHSHAAAEAAESSSPT